ncbi:MAG: carbohydrate ABC transporter permease [Pseudomonadota bacterium]
MMHKKTHKKRKLSLSQRVAYSIVIGGALLMVLPLYMMFVFATHTDLEILSMPAPLWFGNAFMDNLNNLLNRLPFFWTNLSISLRAAGSTALLQLLFCSLAGYAFAVMEFKFKDALFALLLSTMLLPGFLNMIPNVLLIDWLGWMDRSIALIGPASVSAFGIFLMRQYITKAVPRELLEAARLDGCSSIGIYGRIVLPLVAPALAALGLIAFISSWNNVMAPLMTMHEMKNYTAPLALRSIVDRRGLPPLGALFAAAALSATPALLLFALCARKLFQNLSMDSTAP